MSTPNNKLTCGTAVVAGSDDTAPTVVPLAPQACGVFSPDCDDGPLTPRSAHRMLEEERRRAET